MTTLNLSIQTLDNSVTQTGAQLQANETGATYQWFECPAYNLLAGETNALFVATSKGDYAVQISKNNCIDTSSCIPVTNVQLANLDNFDTPYFYPNPTTGKLLCSFPIDVIEVYTPYGQLVKSFYHTNAITLVGLASGTYYLRLEYKTHRYHQKLIKE